MPKPRHAQISLDTTPYYHCVSRCVRRAFLCGEDSHSGQSYEHRRQWIENKLLELGALFAIDICAYAVMSNHYHVVLYIDKVKAEAWSTKEVIYQWHQLFTGQLISRRYMKGDKLSLAELKLLEASVSVWRERLMDISWLMRVLNEHIARKANKEDGCTGRFWEGRFKSQALLDDVALAACMAYVDLNPIRAGVAETPESSSHTSIKRRIKKAQDIHQSHHLKQPVRELMPFVGNPRKDMPKGLPFRFSDYLELVDWSGRILRDDKRGAIPEQLPPIMNRLKMDPKHWLYLTQHYESLFKGFVGSVYKLKQACQALGYKRTPGIQGCEQYFP